MCDLLWNVCGEMLMSVIKISTPSHVIVFTETALWHLMDVAPAELHTFDLQGQHFCLIRSLTTLWLCLLYVQMTTGKAKGKESLSHYIRFGWTLVLLASPTQCNLPLSISLISPYKPTKWFTALTYKHYRHVWTHCQGWLTHGLDSSVELWRLAHQYQGLMGNSVL